MKKIVTLLLLAACAMSSYYGQAGPGNGARLQDRARQLTRHLAEKTPLNEGQYVKVRQLNLRFLTEMSEARQQLAANGGALDAAISEIQLRYEWDLATILSPRQMASYDHAKHDLTALSVR